MVCDGAQRRAGRAPLPHVRWGSGQARGPSGGVPTMKRLSAYGPSLIVLLTVIVVLKAGPSAVWQLTYAHDKARIVQAAEGLERNPILQQINQAYRDLAALVSPSVVHISTERIVRDRLGQVRPGGFAGSGWIYDEDGHIVTNYHVVEKAERIEVQL